MKTITAYQCQYCAKVYARSVTAKSHERKCYFNPATQSCASCAFLDLISLGSVPRSSASKEALFCFNTSTALLRGSLLRFDIAMGYSTDFQVCLKNEDISQRKLRTKCPLYHKAEFHEEYDFKINIPDYTFDRDLALQRLSDKIDEWKKEYELHQTELQAEEYLLEKEDDIDFPF